MSVIEAIVLGIVQGLTEFLPISSSGHLVIVPWLFDWEEPGLAFDAALHLGTLVAVFAYFWKDLLAMLLAVPRALRSPVGLLRGDPSSLGKEDLAARLALLLILGSIPGGIVGLLAQSTIDDFFHGSVNERRAIALIAIMLILFGLALGWADRRAQHRRALTTLGPRDALAVGAAQALALFPGVSRSGVTLTAGLLRGIKRADAARFSFLLGTPLVTLAGAKGVFAAIWALLRLLQTSNTMVFVVYRVVAGVAILLVLASGLR
jgi:undecaprenyl-diphosphatase